MMFTVVSMCICVGGEKGCDRYTETTQDIYSLLVRSMKYVVIHRF